MAFSPKDWRNGPDATTPLSAAGLEDLEARLAAYADSVVTSGTDASAIHNTIIDAKGDLIAGTADNTPARLAAGTNGHVLTADSTATPGVKWAAAATTASAISFTPTGTIAATNVQTAIAEAASESGSTAASGVTFTPANGIAATNVQAAIEEAKTDNDIASEVAFTPTGSIAATNVQAAIAEVASEGATLTASTASVLRATTGAPTVLATDILGDFAVDTTAGILYGPLTGSPVLSDPWINGATSDAVIQPLGGSDYSGGLVAPFNPLLAAGPSGMLASNGGRGCRVIVPRSGQLRDLAVYIGTASGNICMGVYDVGETTTTVRTRLYTTGSVACPAAGWAIVGDPNIAVTQGQHLEFMFSADNASVLIQRYGASVAGTSQLPSGYLPVSGASLPKLGYTVPTVFPLPTTMAEATLTAATITPLLIARIS